MLDIKLAKKVKDAIDKKYAPYPSPLSLDDVCRMEPIPNVRCEGYTVLAAQFGDCTILVRTKCIETDYFIQDVKTQKW